MRSLSAVCALFLVVSGFTATYTATFDELIEGYWSQTGITSGGVRLFAIDQNLGGTDNFTVEAANSGDLGAWFTPPNVCGFGGYVPGTGEAFGRLRSFSFDLGASGHAMKSASLDFWTLLYQQAGNYVTLEGWKGTSLVNTMSYTPATFVIDHVILSVPTDDYDKFVIRCSGPVDNGVLFANVDNVSVTAVPEPGSLCAVGAAVVAMVVRRRR